MAIKILQDKSSITNHLLAFHKRKTPGAWTVDINLSYCSKYVGTHERFNPSALGKAASALKNDLNRTFRDGALVVSDCGNQLHIEISSKDRGLLEETKQKLNDFKLDNYYNLNHHELIESLSPSASKLIRVRNAKFMACAADLRHVSMLRQALFFDKSLAVNREALKALGQLEYAQRMGDLNTALQMQDSDRVLNSIASAFIYGNKYVFSGNASFPPKSLFYSSKNPLWGVAAGDTIGLPAEFYTREQIIDTYGGPVKGPLIPSNLAYFYGQNSDDTHLTLMIKDSIDQANGFQPELFAHYLAEHALQIDTMGIPISPFGFNTLQSARRLYTGTSYDKSGGNYSTCSPSIRVIPLAMFYGNDFDTLESAIASSAMITHNNKTAMGGAVAVGFMSAALLSEDGSVNPFKKMDWLCSKVADYDAELSKRLKLAFHLARENADNEKAYSELGNSSETMEVVPLAFYSFLRTPDNFETTVLTAVNAGGDADSIGSIAGGLSASLNDEKTIPSNWIRDLRDKQMLHFKTFPVSKYHR